MIFSALFVTSTAFADDYPVPANGQCNGNDAKVNVNGEETCRTATTTTTPESEGGDKVSSNEGQTCAVEKLGWILCPIIETGGKMGDRAFQFLSKTFLETEPELVASNPNGPARGTEYAWNLARNIANIMFIIAFLIIIYSQVTGAGITNYGIKKMLPRLIVAAIAVNASYYICQIMVDLTNILGYEIQNFMVDTARQISVNAALPVANGSIFSENSPGTLETIAGAVLGTLGLVWFFLTPLILGVSTVVITCLIIVAILLLRKAFIVLLIVVSPIAFVLYLLPNTEKLFNKWLSMFWKLLMVFPVVGLLMGSGQLASAVILAAGSTGNDGVYASGDTCVTLPAQGSGSQATTGKCGTKATPLLLGLVAAGIAVAPLLAVWSVLKGALAAAGALGGKIAGAVQTYGQKGGNAATEKYKNSTVGQMRERSKKIREGEIRAGRYEGKYGSANPRNWRNSVNKRLNALDVRDDGSGYGNQRKRMNDKADNEYVSGKAEQWAADMSYESKFKEAETKYQQAAATGNERDKHQADLDMKAAVYAAGRAFDEDKQRDLRNRYRNRGGGATPQAQPSTNPTSPTQPTNIPPSAAGTGGGTAGGGTSGGPGSGSGAGTPPGGATPPPTTASTTRRQTFGAQPMPSAAPGARAKAYNRAAADKSSVGGMSDDELKGAAKVASGMNDAGAGQHNDETGQAIVDEMIKRGIDPTQHM